MMHLDTGIYEYWASAWPAKELASVEYGAPQSMRRAFQETEAMFDEFKALRTEILNDKKLSAVGVKDAQDKWAAQKLPVLVERIETIRKEVASAEAGLLKKMQEKLVDGSDEYRSEVLAWLRTMPNDLARSDAIRRLVENGDYSALRVVLRVPPYLAGVDQETLGYLRDDALQRIEPERYGKLEAIRKGRDASEKAISAAIRAVEQVVNAPILEPSQPLGPEPSKAKPLDPETARRISDATEAAIARQEAADRPQAT